MSQIYCPLKKIGLEKGDTGVTELYDSEKLSPPTKCGDYPTFLHLNKEAK